MTDEDSGVQTPGTTDGVVTQPVPCVGCRYDLQGLGADAACPECALSVRTSLDPNRLMFAPDTVAEYRKGLAFFVVSMAVAIICCVAIVVGKMAVDVGDWQMPLERLATIILALGPVVGLVGLWRLSDFSARRTAWMSFAMMAGASVLGVSIVLATVCGHLDTLCEYAAGFGIFNGLMLGISALAGRLGQLARRGPSRRLARFGSVLMGTSGVVAVLITTLIVLEMNGYYPTTNLEIAGAVVISTGLYGTVLATPVLLILVWRYLRRIEAIARA